MCTSGSHPHNVFAPKRADITDHDGPMAELAERDRRPVADHDHFHTVVGPAAIPLAVGWIHERESEHPQTCKR